MLVVVFVVCCFPRLLTTFGTKNVKNMPSSIYAKMRTKNRKNIRFASILTASGIKRHKYTRFPSIFDKFLDIKPCFFLHFRAEMRGEKLCWSPKP